MPSIVFVHGIGVRDGECPAVRPYLENGLEAVRPAIPVTFCYWGGDHGARLDEEPDTPPPPPHVQQPEQVLRARLAALRGPAVPEGAGLDRYLGDAVGDLTATEVAEDCLTRAPAIRDELPAAPPGSPRPSRTGSGGCSAGRASSNGSPGGSTTTSPRPWPARSAAGGRGGSARTRAARSSPPTFRKTSTRS